MRALIDESPFASAVFFSVGCVCVFFFGLCRDSSCDCRCWDCDLPLRLPLAWVFFCLVWFGLVWFGLCRGLLLLLRRCDCCRREFFLRLAIRRNASLIAILRPCGGDCDCDCDRDYDCKRQLTIANPPFFFFCEP